jgi:hypothetical protein
VVLDIVAYRSCSRASRRRGRPSLRQQDLSANLGPFLKGPGPWSADKVLDSGKE